MLAIQQSLGTFIIDLFKSRRRLEAENLFLRHQLSIAARLVLRGPASALTQIEDATLLASYDHATEQIFRAKLRLNLNGFRSAS
jgi:hypothetical protein